MTHPPTECDKVNTIFGWGGDWKKAFFSRQPGLFIQRIIPNSAAAERVRRSKKAILSNEFRGGKLRRFWAHSDSKAEELEIAASRLGPSLLFSSFPLSFFFRVLLAFSVKTLTFLASFRIWWKYFDLRMRFFFKVVHLYKQRHLTACSF